MTVLQHLSLSLLHTARHNPSDVVAPAVVLWTDPDSQWVPLLPRLRALHPELLTLGEYDVDSKTGPAIWIRAAIDRALTDVTRPEDRTPIIYLPGVGRQDLRAGDQCPRALQPLVELQYRGCMWLQRNAKDWTLEAFLVSEDDGLGLTVARDAQTRAAMLGALRHLADTKIEDLQGRHLEAVDFDSLVIQDTPRDLLLWMCDPDGMRHEWKGSRWEAFRSQCHTMFKYNPESEGVLVAGECLGKHADAWENVWQRFREAPSSFPQIADVLRMAKPVGEIPFDREPWPDENAHEEGRLRQALLGMAQMTSKEAAKKMPELEDEHGFRRQWVWAELGQAPLAQGLFHLSALAELVQRNPPGDDVQALFDFHVTIGYRVDNAVLKAFASVQRDADVAAVTAAIRSLYKPWLDENCQRFQHAVMTEGKAFLVSSEHTVAARDGEVLLFVDGLRYDLAVRLREALASHGITPSLHARRAAVPTVTPTAKPAVTPVAALLVQPTPDAEFAILDDGKPLNATRLRQKLRDLGYQVLEQDESGDPSLEGARAWTEYGEFDALGHKMQEKLVNLIDDQLALLEDRIRTLFHSGWRWIRVITDHGWLFLPGRLPFVSLPKFLTKTRYSRCARIRENANLDEETAPWSWNVHYRFAFARGIGSYLSGAVYAHGGLSPQECVIPELLLETDMAQDSAIRIETVQWHRMRCEVQIAGATGSVMVDVRLKPGDAGSSIVEPKMTDDNGAVRLLVVEDSYEGSSATVVVLDATGAAIKKSPTIVGGTT